MIAALINEGKKEEQFWYWDEQKKGWLHRASTSHLL